MLELVLLMLVVVAAATAIGFTILMGIRAWLKRQENKAHNAASTDLAAMFIFIDPAKLYRYSLGLLVVVPIGLYFLFKSLESNRPSQQSV